MLFSWKSRRVDVFQAHTRRTIFLAQVQCLFCNIIFIIICIHIFSISWLKSSFWMLAWFGDLETEREKRCLQLSPHPYFEHTISHQNKHKHKKEQISIKKTHKYLNANKMWKTKYGKVGAEVLRSAHSTDTWLTRLPIYWPEPKLGQISYFYQRNTHNRIWEIWRRKNHSSDTQSRYGK